MMLQEKFINQLKEEKAQKEVYLTQGYAPDFPTYRFIVGKIQGLTSAIEIHKEIFKRGED